MQTSRIALAAVAVIIAYSVPAEARRHHQPVTQGAIIAFCGDRVCPVVGPVATWRAGRQAANREAVASRVAGGGSDGRRGAVRPSHGEMAHGGYVTVPTAAGIDIKVSADFAPKAQAAIAAAVAEGMRFRRINCFDLRRTHKALSNHKTGDACDTYPSIPARIVRAAGLRSGCDFADCPHIDNARNVGGVAYWNSVRHGWRRSRTQIARQ